MTAATSSSAGVSDAPAAAAKQGAAAPGDARKASIVIGTRKSKL
jgi:hypothetical protein